MGGGGAQRECSSRGGRAGSVRDGGMNGGMRGSFKIMRRKKKDEGWRYKGAWFVAAETEREGDDDTSTQRGVCARVCDKVCVSAGERGRDFHCTAV